ncbi:MAG: tyrosine-type recombinase/integrase [Spirochaetota bacterium]
MRNRVKSKNRKTTRPDHYSEQEVMIILDCARKESPLAYSITHFMYAAGLRLREICNLKVGEIDLGKEVVYVHDDCTLRSRVVPLLIPSVSRDYLESHSARRGKADRFFVTENMKAITKNTVRSLFKSVGKKAGIQISSHKLRRSVAIHLYDHGAQIERIRAILGCNQSRLIQWSLPLSVDQLRNCMNEYHPLAIAHRLGVNGQMK